MIAYNPILLLQPAQDGEALSVFSIAIVIITSTIGVYALASSLGNFLITRLALLERCLLFIGALLLIKPGLLTDAAGLVVCGLTILYHVLTHKKRSSYEVAA